MVELRQVVNDENTLEYIETPTKRPINQEVKRVSAKKKCRAPLGDINIIMNTQSSTK